MTLGTRYLEGRHAIVTGGGRGIGAAIAEHLAALGATLTLMGRDEARLVETAERVHGAHRGRVDAVICDVGDEASIQKAFTRARDRLGPAYILVNNAGVAASAKLHQMDRAMWDRIIAVDLTGTMLCMQQVLPDMLAAGAGRIINIASTAGLKGYTKLGAYCAAKHGVIGLTRAAALETVRQGVTVNAVCPGYTETDMAQQAIDGIVASLGKTPDEAKAIIMRMNPRGTLISVDEVANAVAWLSSPAASAITGQAIAVAGGEIM